MKTLFEQEDLHLQICMIIIILNTKVMVIEIETNH